MIISHKYKFIFFRPRKVAGSSVQTNLAKHCGPDDIVTRESKFSEEADENYYESIFKNDDGFTPHITPREIKKKIDKKIWRDYFKFTIVRNPYDMLVSRYLWECWERENNPRSKINLSVYANKNIIKKNILNPGAYIKALKIIRLKLRGGHQLDDFSSFVENLPLEATNNDFYLKQESIEEDYKKLCKRLNIPYEELPRLKTKLRKDKRHYSSYYNNQTKNIVAKKCKRVLDYFGYKFEGL